MNIEESIFVPFLPEQLKNRKNEYFHKLEMEENGDVDIRMAAQIGWYDRVKEIILKTPEYDIVYETAMCNAARNGHLDIVKILVDEIPFRVNAALSTASRNGHLDIVKFLISKGANPKIYDNEALKNALAGNHLDIARYLIPLSDLEFVKTINPDYLKESIHTMALMGMAVSTIVESINIDEPDANGYTPLMYAVLNGHADTVKTLLENNANTDKINKVGQTAVDMARCIGDNEMLELLQKNERIDESIFISLDDEQMKERKDQYDRMYNVRWFNAVENFNYGKLKEMIANGQDVNVRNNKQSLYMLMDDTALLHISRYGNDESALIRRTKDVILDNPATNINVREEGNFDDRTPLILSIMNKNWYVFNKLMERPELDVNMRDYYGETALMMAVISGNEGFVRLLLEKKDINVNMRNTDGKTALDFATELENYGRKNIMVMLKDHGAISRKTNENILEEAFRNNDMKLVRKLIPETDVRLVEEMLNKYVILKESIFIPPNRERY